MGAEIALVFALAGKDVLMNDVGEDNLARAMERLAGVLDKGVQRGFYAPEQKAQALARIRPTTQLTRYADRQLVVEAVFEDEQVKAETFRKLDAILADGCIIASNTSTISITVLSSYVGPERRARFVGSHFFSPVSRMKLVEVIPGIDTSADTVAIATQACVDAGKTPITVKDVVGFAVNRMLHAFMIEAIRLVEEGVATPEELDLACKLGLGHPIGPFELMDATQNSLSLQVQGILREAYGERFQPRPLLRQMVQAGYNGKRAGRGWYRYDKK
jgi:3-hydroxybutyryl-CoA dehydrogenase